MYNILICDDEQDIVNALKIYLANPDYHLLEAHTGQEALDALERKDIHLVLLDIMLPEQDGMEILRRLRSENATRRVPVMMLTAPCATRSTANSCSRENCIPSRGGTAARRIP